MIFKQALQRELSRTFTATLVVLVTIVMTMMLIRTLGLASKGSVNPQEVFLVMAYSVLGHISTILTLALFISLVSVLTRMSRDSEMIIWLTSGQSLSRFVRPLFAFSMPLLVTIAVLALLVWPWTNGQMQELRSRFEQRGDLERIVPGQFQESANGNRVFYIDKLITSGNTTVAGGISEAHNIFIANFEHGSEVITSARTGRIETIQGEPFLVLQVGQRLERNLGGIKLTQFQTLGSKINNDAGALSEAQMKSQSSLALIQQATPDALGEFAWRLSLVLAAINFIVLSIALSSFNPRSGRSSHLGVALLAFVLYYNMMNIAQAWIASGRAGFWLTLILLHGTVFLLSSGWLWLKEHRVAR